MDMTPQEIIANLKSAEEACNQIARERASFIAAAEAQLHYVNSMIARLRLLASAIQKKYIDDDEGEEWKRGEKSDS